MTLHNLKKEIEKEFEQLCPGYQITDWSGKNPQTLPMMVQKENVEKFLSSLHSRYLEAFREMVEGMKKDYLSEKDTHRVQSGYGYNKALSDLTAILLEKK